MSLLLEFRLRRTLKRMRDEESCTPETRKHIRMALKDQKVFNALQDRAQELVDNSFDGPMQFGDDIAADPTEEPTSRPLLRFLWSHRAEIVKWLLQIILPLLVMEKAANEPAS